MRTQVLAIAATLALAATSSFAAVPEIPTPSNPFPQYPVATDGSSLAGSIWNGGVQSGRSLGQYRALAPVKHHHVVR